MMDQLYVTRKLLEGFERIDHSVEVNTAVCLNQDSTRKRST